MIIMKPHPRSIKSLFGRALGIMEASIDSNVTVIEATLNRIVLRAYTKEAVYELVKYRSRNCGWSYYAVDVTNTDDKKKVDESLEWLMVMRIIDYHNEKNGGN